MFVACLYLVMTWFSLVVVGLIVDTLVLLFGLLLRVTRCFVGLCLYVGFDCVTLYATFCVGYFC